MRNLIQKVKALLVFLILSSCQLQNKIEQKVIVLKNSQSKSAWHCNEQLVPYLTHFGFPFLIIDVKDQDKINAIEDCPLIIISHEDFLQNIPDQKEKLLTFLSNHQKNGTGIVSFDAQFPVVPDSYEDERYVAKSLSFKLSHFITEYHKEGEKFRLFGEMELPKLSYTGFENLIILKETSFLSVSKSGQNKTIIWTSQDWMNTTVLGPLGGLDDCLWRSIVWAAKKPFAMHSIPPIVTMRVDDVAGRGELWDESPFYWVKTANKYDIKPWLGLFIYNLNPKAIDELRPLLLKGLATASPHALGRPPRTNKSELDIEHYAESNDSDIYAGFYYYPDAMPLRVDSYDEFIYFDHHSGKPWSDKEALNGLIAVDEWYEIHKPFPMCKYLVPHWYEIGSNIIDYATDNWGMEFICLAKDIDLPLNRSVDWLKSGPYRNFEKPRNCMGWGDSLGMVPVYYADFVSFGDKQLFNFVCEIRDDAGYEWAPDNDVEATIGRGVRQLKRAITSKAPGVLMTHETDYIYLISPENWEEELKQISEGVADFNPLYMTTDEMLVMTRAYHTSSLKSYVINSSNNSVNLNFTGQSDATTFFDIYYDKDGEIEMERHELQPFSNKKSVIIK